MRGRQLVLLLALVSSLAGCGKPASPTPMPVMAQPTPRPSKTAVVEEKERRQDAEAYVAPTSIPEPALRTSGPYFAYFRRGTDGYQFVLMDADGAGRKVVDLPEEVVNAYPDKPYVPDINFVSPDGHWLAFYTGFAGDMWDATAQGPYDLTLKLLNLTTGEIKVVTPLLSADYPDNFTRAADGLKKPEITAESLQGAFLNGIMYSLSWSPDGQHLAFAGQMDGLSSDLYVYDVNSGRIRRLSSGDQELQWINWSPDGKWILHGSVFWVGQGMSFDVYAAAADGSSIQYVSTASLYGGIEEWVNAHQYFEYENQNGPGSYALRLVDIDTGNITDIWDGSFGSYEADSSGKWLVLTALSPDVSPYSYADDPEFRAGLYLVNLTTLEKIPIDYPPDEFVFHYEIFPIKNGSQIFFLNNRELAYAFYLSETGEVSPVDIEETPVSFSANQEYWIAVDNREAKIFSIDNKLIRSVQIPGENKAIADLCWSPDSSDVFLLSEKNIYVIDIPTGQIQLVETNLANSDWGPVYLWVNGQ